MDQIRPWLYIGKYRDTKNYQRLFSHNITAMLLLAELVEYDGITSLYLPVEDGEPLPENHFRTGIEFILNQREKGNKILVACGAGISRSGTYTIAALIETEKLSLLDAFHVVKEAHPETFPHFALWNSLCDFYGETVSWREMLS